MRTSAAERLLVAVAIFVTAAMAVILMARLFNQRGGAVNVPRPVTPLPTFALSPAIQARIAASNSPYLCQPVMFEATRETATCASCALYPVDKLRGLPASYVPRLVPTGLKGGGLVTPETKAALAALFAGAQAKGHTPAIASAYRSYREQAATFEGWYAHELSATGDQRVALLNAARYSARAGHSEHQLGTTADVNCSGCAPFDDQDKRNLALWKFLEEEAHTYGFVISYPRDIEALTGFMYEPWHIRYIGVDLAEELYAQGYLQGSGVCLSGFLRAKVLYRAPTATPHPPTPSPSGSPSFR